MMSINFFLEIRDINVNYKRMGDDKTRAVAITTLRLETSLMDRIRAEARRERRSLSSQIAVLLEAALVEIDRQREGVVDRRPEARSTARIDHS
jgi:hypothetical protein